MLPLSLLTALALLSVGRTCDAILVHPRAPAGRTINLVRSRPKAWSKQEWGSWAKGQKLALEAKYRGSSERQVQRRATGTN